MNANFLTSTLCGMVVWYGRTSAYFTKAYSGENKSKNMQRWYWMYHQVDLGNNCPMLYVNDVVPRARRIKYIQLTTKPLSIITSLNMEAKKVDTKNHKFTSETIEILRLVGRKTATTVSRMRERL